MSYEVVWEKEGCKIITTGIFGNNFLQASVKATTDPRFVGVKYGIVDFIGVTDFPIDIITIKQIADSDARAYKVNPNIKVAIVANKTIMCGLVNMYKAYFELANSDKTWTIKIFESEAEAKKWINAIQRDTVNLISDS